ncbi:MAG: hypothetical protein ABI266_04900 [Ginsengibacter sp.]
MVIKKCCLLLNFLLFFSITSHAQIEVAHVSSKGYSAIGYGAFLNFSLAVSEGSYATLEGGVQYFKDKNKGEFTSIPFLAGFRYTLNQSGEGFYVEPTAGYAFSMSDYDEGNGIAAGLGMGYLFDITNIPFNVGIRYLHSFDNSNANVISLRISHSLTFGRRNRD